MEVSEVFKRKQMLIEHISDLIRLFEKETELNILDIKHQWHCPIDCSSIPNHKCPKVEITIRL